MATTETRLVVTGSEAAAACGVDPFRSPVALWSEKLGLAVERADNEAMRWGTLLEPVIRSEVEARGYATAPAPEEAITHADYPWLTGHPDGYVLQPQREAGILEIKTTSTYRREEWADGHIPPHVVVQATVYMMLTASKWALVAALIGGQRLEVREFDYDEAIAALIAERTEDFLEHVATRIPPPPDGAKSTSAALARLWPGASGETVELDPGMITVVREREALRQQAKVIDKQIEEHDQALKMALGSASYGTHEGRRVVSWVERKGYELAARSVAASRVLRVTP